MECVYTKQPQSHLGDILCIEEDGILIINSPLYLASSICISYVLIPKHLRYVEGLNAAIKLSGFFFIAVRYVNLCISYVYQLKNFQ